MVHSQLMIAMLFAYVFIIFSEVAEANSVSKNLIATKPVYRLVDFRMVC